MGLACFSEKDQTVHISEFTGPEASVAVPPLCCCAARDRIQSSRCCAPTAVAVQNLALVLIYGPLLQGIKMISGKSHEFCSGGTLIHFGNHRHNLEHLPSDLHFFEGNGTNLTVTQVLQ